MVTKTKIKETETFNVKTVDTPSDLVAVNDSQLGLFDYSNYSEDFKLKSYERKARIKANEQVATKAFYDIAQDVKAQHDEMNNYQEWLKWCDKELGYKSRMSEQFLQIAKELPQRVAVDKFPNSFRGLNALASALSKANEETKEEILTAVESKTEEKGKALTEKEIKEITARIKEEYEEKINQLTEDLKEAKQGELFFQKTLEKKQEDYNDLQDTYSQKVTEIQNYESTIKNQNKKIEELNSSISIKENELNSIAQEKDEIEQKQSKLEILIKKEADKIVKNELKLKKQLLSNQEAELKDKSGKLTKELKEVQKLKTEIEKEKSKLITANTWLELITEFNLEFAKSCARLKLISSELNKLPNFAELPEQTKQRADQQMMKFSDNLEEFGKFNNRIIVSISKVDMNPLKAYDVTEITAEVIDD